MGIGRSNAQPQPPTKHVTKTASSSECPQSVGLASTATSLRVFIANIKVQLAEELVGPTRSKVVSEARATPHQTRFSLSESTKTKFGGVPAAYPCRFSSQPTCRLSMSLSPSASLRPHSGAVVPSPAI